MSKIKKYSKEFKEEALKQKEIEVSLLTVYRTMCEGGLLHRVRRPHGITKVTTEIQEQENLIKRDFNAETPYTKLLTDITRCRVLAESLSGTGHCFDNARMESFFATLKKRSCTGFRLTE